MTEMPLRSTQATAHPCGPLKAKGFKQALDHFRGWLERLDAPYDLPLACQRAAKAFAIRGFENWRQVEGLSPADVQGWSTHPPTKALLSRVVGLSASKFQAAAGETAITPKDLAEKEAVLGGGLNAEKLAGSLTLSNLQAAEQHNALECKRRKLDGLGSSVAPRRASWMLS